QIRLEVEIRAGVAARDIGRRRRKEPAEYLRARRRRITELIQVAALNPRSLLTGDERERLAAERDTAGDIELARKSDLDRLREIETDAELTRAQSAGKEVRAVGNPGIVGVAQNAIEPRRARR